MPTPPTDDVQSLLRQGLLSARDDRYAQALGWFRAARDKDPDNIVALLWLAWLAPTRQESLELLSHVLELDPKNERARAALRWARSRPADKRSEESHAWGTTPLETPTRSELLRDVLDSAETQEKARSGIAAHRARRFMGPLGLLLMSAVCLFLAGAVLVAQVAPASMAARLLSSVTPTLTAPGAASLVSQADPTATATATATGSAATSPIPSTPVAPTGTPTAPAPSPGSASPALSAYPQGLVSAAPAPATPASPSANPLVSAAPNNEKWIDVDLTHQRMTAYEGNTPVFETLVSTGLPNTPTVAGRFRIYLKLSATDMAGPGYYLPDVPYTMYFHRGYALHGTYWHHNFGQPMSHGCVNLRTEDAKWLFDWASPLLPPKATSVRANDTNPGTLVVVHY